MIPTTHGDSEAASHHGMANWLTLILFPAVAVIVGALVVILSLPKGPPLPDPGGRAAPERGFYRPRDDSAMVDVGSMLMADPATVGLRHLDGTVVDAATLMAGSAWVAFWSPDCPACDADLATMNQALARHPAAGLRVVAIMVGGLGRPGTASIPAAVARVLLLDPSRSVLDGVGVFGSPTHLFVGATGRVVDRFLGPIPARELDDRLTMLLKGGDQSADDASSPPPGA